MSSHNQKIKKLITYWKVSAESNWETTLILFKNKRYDACLFFCHLTLEKMLKGLVVEKTKDQAPFIHDLPRLVKLAALELNPEQIKHLRIIDNFNIAGRYADYKYKFYKQCTKKYTQKYLSVTKEIVLCLKKEYQKK